MNFDLAKPIEMYFQAANAHDSSTLAGCFTSDAIVYDEDEEHRGLAAIAKWNEAAGKKYNLTLQILSAKQADAQTVVTAMAAGHFEGSPAVITFRFTVKDQRITALYCG